MSCAAVPAPAQNQLVTGRQHNTCSLAAGRASDHHASLVVNGAHCSKVEPGRKWLGTLTPRGQHASRARTSGRGERVPLAHIAPCCIPPRSAHTHNPNPPAPPAGTPGGRKENWSEATVSPSVSSPSAGGPSAAPAARRRRRTISRTSLKTRPVSSRPARHRGGGSGLHWCKSSRRGRRGCWLWFVRPARGRCWRSRGALPAQPPPAAAAAPYSM